MRKPPHWCACKCLDFTITWNNRQNTKPMVDIETYDPALDFYEMATLADDRKKGGDFRSSCSMRLATVARGSPLSFCLTLPLLDKDAGFPKTPRLSKDIRVTVILEPYQRKASRRKILPLICNNIYLLSQRAQPRLLP